MAFSVYKKLSFRRLKIKNIRILDLV